MRSRVPSSIPTADADRLTGWPSLGLACLFKDLIGPAILSRLGCLSVGDERSELYIRLPWHRQRFYFGCRFLPQLAIDRQRWINLNGWVPSSRTGRHWPVLELSPPAYSNPESRFSVTAGRSQNAITSIIGRSKEFHPFIFISFAYISSFAIRIWECQHGRRSAPCGKVASRVGMILTPSSRSDYIEWAKRAVQFPCCLEENCRYRRTAQRKDQQPVPSSSTPNSSL